MMVSKGLLKFRFLTVRRAVGHLMTILRKPERGKEDLVRKVLALNHSENKRNKRLAKDSRDRKAKYIKDLESEIAQLKAQNRELMEKLESYKKERAYVEIGDNRGYNALKEAQESWHQQLSIALKETEKDSDTSTRLKNSINYLSNTLGPAGTDRKRVVKNAFKVIIKSLVPDSCQVVLFANNNTLRASDKELETLLKSSEYKYNELMRTKGFGVVEEIITKAGITKQQRPYLHAYCKQLTEVRKEYENIVKECIRLRNKVFPVMERFQEINSELTKHVEPKQVGHFIE